MPKGPYKLTKAKVKKAIKQVEVPSWAGLAKILKCHHFTVQHFLMQPENKDLDDLLQERRGHIDTVAVNLIEDNILAGDEKLALKWLDFKHKREIGNKVEIEGALDINVIIKRKDDEDE